MTSPSPHPYLPFGEARAAIDLPTDKLFTGQRLDATGLYYYNARYYDPTIGRFISPDIIIPYPTDPQSFNRYSYCRNNPLKYVDPSGNLDSDYAVLLQWLEEQHQKEEALKKLAETSKDPTLLGAADDFSDAPLPANIQAILDTGTGGGTKSDPFDPFVGILLASLGMAGGASLITINEGDVGHIFRNAEGHFKVDKPEYRTY